MLFHRKKVLILHSKFCFFSLIFFLRQDITQRQTVLKEVFLFKIRIFIGKSVSKGKSIDLANSSKIEMCYVIIVATNLVQKNKNQEMLR